LNFAVIVLQSENLKFEFSHLYEFSWRQRQKVWVLVKYCVFKYYF